MNFIKKLFNKVEEKPIENYQDFWNWFLINEKKFFKVVKQGGSNNISINFFDKIAPKLDQLKEGVWYLTGMLNDNTADLILTSDGNISNYYLIEELIEAAPKLKKWKFRAHKPENNIDNVVINMSGYTFNKKNIFFYSSDSKDYPDEININLIHNDFSEKNENDIINGCYIFLDNYLGELNSTLLIDNVEFKSRKNAEKELIPIHKLKSFIIWRQKEFVEKYYGIRRNTENDSYSSLEATLENGNKLFAVVNSDLLKWESKCSHPWVLRVKVKYNGEKNNGLPDKKTYDFLNNLEEEISIELKDINGYLNIGRETSNNLREIYFACKDFKKPCKILDNIIKKYSNKSEIKYFIYKDKYWSSFDRFQV